MGEDEEGGRASVERVLTRLHAGDTDALVATAAVGRSLGTGIADLINIFNPAVVVLGGLFNRLYQFISGALTDGINSRVLGAPGSMAAVVPAGLGADALVIGAAEMALTHVLEDPEGHPSSAAATRRGALAT